MIFVDTSAWLALVDANDRDHRAALSASSRIARGEFGKQVTTNYVLTETVTMVRRELGVSRAVALASALASSKEVQTLWIEPVHHNAAIEFLADHEDKDWSVTDCTSFVVMSAMGIDTAFTFDRDFAQAGYSVVP